MASQYSHNRDRSEKKRIGFYLKGLVSLGLMFYVLYKAGPAELIETLKDTNLLFLGLCLAIAPLLIFLSSWKWKILLKAQDIEVSLTRLFALYLVGCFFNNLLPSNVGGDVVRAYELGKYTQKKAESWASVFLERFTGLTVLIFLALIASLVKVGSFTDVRLTVAIGAVVVSYVIIFSLVLDQRIFAFVRKKTKTRILNELLNRLQKFQSAIAAYKGKNRALGIAIIISFFFYVAAVINVYLGCLAFSVHLPLLKLFIAVPIILTICLIPISLGGIGLSEWAYLFVFTQLGATGSLGLSVALLMRAKAVVLGILGGVLYYSVHTKNIPKALPELS